MPLLTPKKTSDPQDHIKWAWRQSGLWPRQNHLLIAIFWIFGVVIFLNISFAAYMIPQMVKTLFGIDSIFTLSGMRMILNTTFCIAILGITYLCWTVHQDGICTAMLLWIRP